MTKFGKSVIVSLHAGKLEFRIAVKERAPWTVRKKDFRIDAVSVQRFEPVRRIVYLEWNFLPTLGIVASVSHRRRTVADVASLDLAVDHPALDGKIKLFFPDFDDMGHAISPFGSRHPTRIGVFAELPVGIRAD